MISEIFWNAAGEGLAESFREEVEETLMFADNDGARGVNNNCAQSRLSVCAQMANMGLFHPRVVNAEGYMERVQPNMHSAARK